MSVLEQIKKYTTVVADTADFDLIAKYTPQVCSTTCLVTLLLLLCLVCWPRAAGRLQLTRQVRDALD